MKVCIYLTVSDRTVWRSPSMKVWSNSEGTQFCRPWHSPHAFFSRGQPETPLLRKLWVNKKIILNWLLCITLVHLFMLKVKIKLLTLNFSAQIYLFTFRLSTVHVLLFLHRKYVTPRNAISITSMIKCFTFYYANCEMRFRCLWRRITSGCIFCLAGCAALQICTE